MVDQDSRIQELTEALEPFANLASSIHSLSPDDAPVVIAETNGGIINTHSRVTVRDIRRARAALEGTK